MKVWVVKSEFRQEEDFGGYQRHSELDGIFLTKASAEKYIVERPPHEDDYYYSDLEFVIVEWDVNE